MKRLVIVVLAAVLISSSLTSPATAYWPGLIPGVFRGVRWVLFGPPRYARAYGMQQTAAPRATSSPVVHGNDPLTDGKPTDGKPTDGKPTDGQKNSIPAAKQPPQTSGSGGPDAGTNIAEVGALLDKFTRAQQKKNEILEKQYKKLVANGPKNLKPETDLLQMTAATKARLEGLAHNDSQDAAVAAK
jgi:hypothetical protein